MALMSRMTCLVAALLVAFVISGCQSSSWATAWRSKPKPQFQGVEGAEQVTYWPYKRVKNPQKPSEMPDAIKDKIAKKSKQSKHDKELADLINEGDVHRRSGNYADARLVYSKALILSPDNPDVTHRMAIVADKEHQYAMADEYYQATLRARPRDVNVLSDLGYSHILREQWASRTDIEGSSRD